MKIFLIITTILYAHTLYARPHAKTEGEVRVGLDYKARKNGAVPFAAADIKISSRKYWGWRAKVKFEGKSSEEEVEFNEGSLLYGNKTGGRWQLGLFKKRQGLEYEKNRSERLIPFRSAIYDKLERLSFVGREMGAHYEKRYGNITWRAGLGLPHSQDYNLRLALINEQAEALANWGAWVLYQNDRRLKNKRENVGSMVFSLWSTQPTLNYQWENTHGIDPAKSEFEDTTGNNRTVKFAGSKLAASLTWFSNEWQIRSFISASKIYHDTQNLSRNQLSLALGAHFTKPTLRLSVIADERRDQHPDLDDDLSNFYTRYLIELSKKI